MLKLTGDQGERRCGEMDKLKYFRAFLEYTRKRIVYQKVNCESPLAQDSTSSNLCYWNMQKAFRTKMLTYGSVCAGSSPVVPKPFLAPGTSFMEDNFSTDGGCGGGGMVRAVKRVMRSGR